MEDQRLFSAHSKDIDAVVEELREISLFPNCQTRNGSWSWEANPNPLVGIAIEIENSLSKYFLGSLLAAAITGRWGIVIIHNARDEQRWVSTLNRMMHKGVTSPIPSNTIIVSWPTLCQRVTATQQGE
jgi:hypothetical protein